VVADDSAEMRTLIRDAVCGSRFEVDEAADGRQLFWMLERCRTSPDARHVVVVADVRMPIYSGLEVLEALDGAHCPFRFIIITSYPDDETRRRVERCGATLLPKPFTVAELRGVLARIGSCAETS
jgi:CheY-like chemotaxis protein